MRVVIVTCDWVKVGSEPSESSKRSNIQAPVESWKFQVFSFQAEDGSSGASPHRGKAPSSREIPNSKHQDGGRGWTRHCGRGKEGRKWREEGTLIQGIPGENRLFPGGGFVKKVGWT